MKRLKPELKQLMQQGLVLPAHPLALTEDRKLDEKRQRLLTNYYIQSGAGGIAVAVHSTQFEIREPQYNLLEPVLRMAAEEITNAKLDRGFLKIAGICGPTAQAVQEAELAASLDYDMALLSMGGLQGWTEDEILERVRAVAAVMPVCGFYLQPSVGGRIFSYAFWQAFAEIDNVDAIKCASFNRYQTLDVMRAVANSSRRDHIVMYTGNDDNILADLLTDYTFNVDGQAVTLNFKGGLLGHWAVWTAQAVVLMEEVKNYRQHPSVEKLRSLLAKGVHVTDCNAAFFDPANHFHGCIPGIHEVLYKQGLLKGIWCLNPNEVLSPGQKEEISRVHRDYPELNDDDFVSSFLQKMKEEGRI